MKGFFYGMALSFGGSRLLDIIGPGPMPAIGNIDPSICDVIFSLLAFAAFLRL